MLIIHASKKIEHGKSISRRLRLNNQCPGIIYGTNKPVLSIILNHHVIFNLQEKHTFFTDNLCIIVDKKEHIVKVQSIQRHSFKLRLLHIDFLYV